MAAIDPPILTRRELGRATLARQLLLDRAAIPADEAIARLAGLQAQVTNPPYIGLWTRLRDFRHEELTRLLEQRVVVRATAMRSTIHLLTAADYLLFRPALGPALARALAAFFGARARGVDPAPLVAATRELLAERPRTFAELRPALAAIEPDRDPDALAYLIRTHVPLVQVFPGGAWGVGGNPAYAEATAWLGGVQADPAESFRALVRRYLAAFGPASARDIGAWSGLTGIAAKLAPLRPALVTFRDERGVELFDLAEAPRPTANTPAPPRFLPEYDNAILAHADRSRIIANTDRPRVFLTAGRVLGTILLDGAVAGIWKVERARRAATLVVTPFAPLAAADCAALAAEGEALIGFIAANDDTTAVRFTDPLVSVHRV